MGGQGVAGHTSSRFSGCWSVGRDCASVCRGCGVAESSHTSAVGRHALERPILDWVRPWVRAAGPG